MVSKKQQLLNVTEKDLIIWCEKYCSASDILRNEFSMSANGNYTAIINTKIKEYGLEFVKPYKTPYKYNRISKICPVCKNPFEVGSGSPEEKTTCSYACSNTYFRSGINNGNYKGNNYRTICFSYHKKECIICGENKIVEVHHVDEDHTNNSEINLVPLCPTHHQYYHSKYKNIVEPDILKYIKERENEYNVRRNAKSYRY